ncbi:hypothetical protein SPBRAN_645 [uncultured Candidatus Thioglobus sp.]|nr:hypothetical protein SPBRAN_645 [uncultured Candidatus Thioglobus sp.]
MKYLLFVLIFIFNPSVHANAKPANPQAMLVIIGAVKYYNENCGGLNYAGVEQMNKGLRYFKMDRTPVAELEKQPLAISSYETAQKFGCEETKKQARQAGFGQYIN